MTQIPSRDRPADRIEITEEMVNRGCVAVHEMGGVPFNPHLDPRTHSAMVREILEAALGLKQSEIQTS